MSGRKRKRITTETSQIGIENERPSLTNAVEQQWGKDFFDNIQDDDQARVAELEARITELTEDAIIVREDGLSRQYKRFELYETELVIPDDVTEDEWVELGVLLMRMKSTIQWVLGDWLVYGMTQKWKDGYSYIEQKFGYEVETLWSYASVCRKVPTLTRIKDLSFSHHRAVTRFADEPDLQRDWLSKALQNDWSAKELVKQIQQANKAIPAKTSSWQPLIATLENEQWQQLPSQERQDAITRLKALLQMLEAM